MESDPITPTPSIGCIVIFRSRTGQYDVPAIITATVDSLNPLGVQAFEKSGGKAGVPGLSGDRCVHLTVFTPGLPGQRASAEDFIAAPSTGIIGENVAGCYQEFDVPEADPMSTVSEAAGTWRWPVRA